METWGLGEGAGGMAVRVEAAPAPVGGAFDAAGTRARSPRRIACAWITVRPPRMMFCVPWICERREILLPVSVEMYSLFGGRGPLGAGAGVEVEAEVEGLGGWELEGLGGSPGGGMVGGWWVVGEVR